MPAHSFSPIAGFYDVLAEIVFGRKLQEAQAANLRYISDYSRILIIGGGSGWILQQVLKHTQHSSIVYLEASDSMLRKSEEINKLILNNKIEYRLGTEENIGVQEKYDLIIANFFLDLFSPVYLIPILEKLYKALAPSAKLLITDFVLPDTSNSPKWRTQVLFKSMYLFFRLTCNISAAALPYWDKYLKSFSLTEINSAYFYHGLVKTIALSKSVA